MLDLRSDAIRRVVPYLSLGCWSLALVLACVRFIEFDAPLTRFVRSLNEYQIDYLHNPWLRELSNGGDAVGKGESLVAVSALLLAAGYLLRQADLTRAGWQTLIAHAVAGGVNTAIKHVVGRARPKFMHTGTSEFSPFAGAGWDSFPSGHATATFAVATILAVRFPKVRWLMMLIAAAVAVSRVFRGAHFLTDIVAGAVLGVVIGSVVAYPLTDWRAALNSALMIVTPPLAALLAVMTTIGEGQVNAQTAMILGQAGLLLSLAGIAAYLLSKFRPAKLPGLTKTAALAFMGLGIVISSESVWVAIVILLLWLGHWLRPENQIAQPLPAWPSEAAFGLGVLLTLLTMIELRGALPVG